MAGLQVMARHERGGRAVPTSAKSPSLRGSPVSWGCKALRAEEKPAGCAKTGAKSVDTEYDRAMVPPYNASDPMSPLEV